MKKRLRALVKLLQSKIGSSLFRSRIYKGTYRQRKCPHILYSFVTDFHFIPGAHPGGFGPFGMLHPQWLDASTYMSYAWPEYFRRTPTELCKLSSALCPSSIKGKLNSVQNSCFIFFMGRFKMV